MKASTYQHQVNLDLWAERIAEQKASGLKIDEWCLQNNLSRHKFFYWKRLLKDSIINSNLPDIVPLSQVYSAEANTIPSVAATFATNTTGHIQNCETSTSCTSDKPTFLNTFKLSTPNLSLEINSALSSADIISIIKAVQHA